MPIATFVSTTEVSPIMIDTTIDLSEFDNAFSANGEEDALPDGVYTARISDVDLTRSRTGNPMITWKLVIDGPDYPGRAVIKRRAITDKTVRFVRRDLEACGLTLDRLSGLSSQMYRMVDQRMEIRKYTHNGEANIYFNGKIEAEPLFAGEPGDDLPF